MSKNKFIEKFCEKNDLKYDFGKKILRNLYIQMSYEIKRNGILSLKDFGKFSLKERQERINNFTGKLVPRHLCVDFKAYKKFKNITER